MRIPWNPYKIGKTPSGTKNSRVNSCCTAYKQTPHADFPVIRYFSKIQDLDLEFIKDEIKNIKFLKINIEFDDKKDLWRMYYLNPLNIDLDRYLSYEFKQLLSTDDDI